MKIANILNNKKLSLSFEVFPPKKRSSLESVEKAVKEIAALKPAFMSVTYGAGGGTGEYTLDIARTIKKDYGVETLEHLTCVSSSKESVKQQIKAIKASGVENILALRGDIPADMLDCDRSNWDYHHATELIAQIKRLYPECCVGSACYPEVHPESRNSSVDIKFLKAKVEAGCEFLTTQMFFDNSLLYSFLYRLREAGITVPVVAGIMPITKASQVEQAIKLSGCHVPQRFKSIVDRFGSDPLAMKQAGIAYATDQIIDLFANGVSNVHVYSMNKPEVARGIYMNLSDILGKLYE